jgi:HPt (histidine-containing phosphotransfer) domain-containing protein
VDTGVLHDFLEMVGATIAEEVNEWLNLFLHDASSALTTIQLAVRADDQQQVMQAAHTLKASSAQIGAHTLSHHCQQLEAMGRTGSLKGAAELVVQTEAEYLRVKEALGVYRTMLRSEKLA